MTITEIKAFPIWLSHRNIRIVKVETDAGIYGLGEAGLTTRELAIEGALRHFREFLIGKDPMQAGRIWQETYRGQYFEGGRVLTSAMAAIDIALYDIKGKALNVPVYELLGGKQRDFIPTFCTVSAPTFTKLVEGIRAYMAVGWRSIRTSWQHSEHESETEEGIWEPWEERLREELELFLVERPGQAGPRSSSPSQRRTSHRPARRRSACPWRTRR